MAAITGTVIMAGAAAYGAKKQGDAAEDAANAQQKSTDLTIREQQRQFDLTRQDQMPWLQAGQGALSQLQQLNSGDFSSFTQSPDYQFALDQGFQGLDRSAAANGSLMSGGHSADLIKYGQGMASQNYGDYYNRIAGLAGVGQTTASGLGSLGMNMANSIGNAHQNNAAAQRQSAYAQGNANSQLAGVIGGLGTGIANNWGAYKPQGTAQTQGWNMGQAGTLGPSNGSTWNFGGGS